MSGLGRRAAASGGGCCGPLSSCPTVPSRQKGAGTHLRVLAGRRAAVWRAREAMGGLGRACGVRSNLCLCQITAVPMRGRKKNDFFLQGSSSSTTSSSPAGCPAPKPLHFPIPPPRHSLNMRAAALTHAPQGTAVRAGVPKPRAAQPAAFLRPQPSGKSAAAAAASLQQRHQRRRQRGARLAVQANTTNYGAEWATPKDAFLTVVRRRCLSCWRAAACGHRASGMRRRSAGRPPACRRAPPPFTPPPLPWRPRPPAGPGALLRQERGWQAGGPVRD